MALNFDSDGRGGNVVVFTGTAIIDRQAQSLDQIAAYVEKYAENIARIEHVPSELRADVLGADPGHAGASSRALICENLHTMRQHELPGAAFERIRSKVLIFSFCMFVFALGERKTTYK